MRHYFPTLLNGGGPLCAIQRLRPYAMTAFELCFQIQVAALHEGAGTRHGEAQRGVDDVVGRCRLTLSNPR
jgi:hypothetical protein